CLQSLLREPLEISEASQLADRALTIASQMENDQQIALVLPEKLRWLVEASRPAEALETFSEYYKLLLATSPDYDFPHCQMQIARALLLQKRFPEAQEQIEESIRSFAHASHSLLLARAMLVRSELYLLQDDYPTAHEYLNEAASIADQLSDKELVLQVNL